MAEVANLEWQLGWWGGSFKLRYEAGYDFQGKQRTPSPYRDVRASSAGRGRLTAEAAPHSRLLFRTHGVGASAVVFLRGVVNHETLGYRQKRASRRNLIGFSRRHGSRWLWYWFDPLRGRDGFDVPFRSTSSDEVIRVANSTCTASAYVRFAVFSFSA